MRKILFIKNMAEKKERQEGYFHTWGYDSLEDWRGGNIMWSMAIVEDLEGNVHRVSVDHIQFTEGVKL